MQLLERSSADFAARFAKIVADRRETNDDVRDAVATIIADVKTRGDDALAELTRRFDGVDFGRIPMRVSGAEVDAAIARCTATDLAALEVAAERIRWFHGQQRPSDADMRDAIGVRMGWRWTPMDAVGLYVPGGLAAYPSSVLMNAIPAKVAGVERLVMVSPTPKGEARDLVLAAAKLAGVDEIWRIGGAQAIAALAYGTRTISPVDKITGPGNAYVAEAKRQLFGQVGIDMIAGPSEILVIADAKNEPDWIAADLLSQAEHDSAAQSILITDDARFASLVSASVERLLPTLASEKIARQSWQQHGVIILVRDLMEEAPALADALAAEHLELCVDDPHALTARVRHAGSVFLGRHTPEAIGDYLGGPNHVLPTGRRARFSSGLSVADYMKRTTFLETPAGAFAQIADSAATLADAEGLPAHALSVRIRG